MAAHVRLKNEFTEDEKCQNLMTCLIFETITNELDDPKGPEKKIYTSINSILRNYFPSAGS